MFTLTPTVTRSDHPAPIADRATKAEPGGRSDPFSDYLKAHDAAREDATPRAQSTPSEPKSSTTGDDRPVETPPTHRESSPAAGERAEDGATRGRNTPSGEAGETASPQGASRGDAKRSDRANAEATEGDAPRESLDLTTAVDADAKGVEGALPRDALADAHLGAAATEGRAPHGVKDPGAGDEAGAKPEKKASRVQASRAQGRDGDSTSRSAVKGELLSKGGPSGVAAAIPDGDSAAHASDADKTAADLLPAAGTHPTDGAPGGTPAIAHSVVSGEEVVGVKAAATHAAVREGAPGSSAPRKDVRREDKAGRIDTKGERTAASESPSLHARVRPDAVKEIQVDLSEFSSHGEGNEHGATDDGEAAEALLRTEAASTERPATTKGSVLASATGNFARRLNGELGTRIVRDARIMLQNADSAEIRLIIRPPELGRVRIRLRMDNGHIAGRILVDNGSVREVMEQNLASLQRAFEEAGLDIGDLEVSTGDAGGETRDGEHGLAEAHNGRRRAGAERFEQHVAPALAYDYGSHRVNLVA